MNKELKKHRFDITDYHIRLWSNTCFISQHYSLDCVLERSNDNELFCFGLQSNLMDDSKDEKVLKLCKEIEYKVRELDYYLKNN